jgi:very-short-patch-repair endonuclease
MTRSDNKSLFRKASIASASVIETRALAMRAFMTPSEELLWSQLRARKLGVLFRRQVPILGRFIVDFLAPSVRLVVEVDGGWHARRQRADARRDAVLERAGYRVVHLPAELVVSQLAVAVERVRKALVV